MKYADYRKRLGIGFNDQEKFTLLRNKIILFIETIQHNSRSSDLKNPYFSDYFMEVGEVPFYNNLNGVQQSLENTDSLKELLGKFMIFVNHIEKHIWNETIINATKRFPHNALNALNIQFDIINDEDGVFIFPKGAEELDNALVSEPLAWLSEYPKAHTAFIKALKEYAKASPENASDIADKFRKALETFMQEFFNTGKSLENCKAIYGAYLAEQGVPKEITGNLETLLQAYTNYINNYAKHKDRTQVNVLEYLLYQTGNIIRLLITLKKREKEEI